MVIHDVKHHGNWDSYEVLYISCLEPVKSIVTD